MALPGACTAGVAAALLQAGWEGGPESFLSPAAEGRLLPAAARPQPALCAAHPRLKAADKGRVLCDKVAFKGSISYRSSQHALPQEGGRRERAKAREEMSQPGSIPHRLRSQCSQRAGMETKGFFSIFLKWAALFLPC